MAAGREAAALDVGKTSGLACTIHLKALPPRGRLLAFFRGLQRPRILALMLLILVFPVAIDRVVALLIPSDGEMIGPMRIIGIGGVVFFLVLGTLIALVSRPAPTTLTFSDDGIHEETPGKKPRVADYPWTWVADVTAAPTFITVYCQAPLRSFRVPRGALHRQVLIEKSHAAYKTLRELIELHTRFRV